MFSGFFSVMISFTSGFKRSRTAVRTSTSSSITRMEAVLNDIVYEPDIFRDEGSETTTMPSLQSSENEEKVYYRAKGVYHKRTVPVRKRTSS